MTLLTHSRQSMRLPVMLAAAALLAFAFALLTLMPNPVGADDGFDVTVYLQDSDGVGIEGGTVGYYLGGWNSVPGQTDSTGKIEFTIANDSSYLSISMTYLGTRNQQNRTELDASNFTFQTTTTTVELRDADGALIDSGDVSYYAGGWKSFGAGTTSGGEVTQEMLSGSYSFAMVYNGSSRQQMNDVAISGNTTTVTFQTGRLSLHFSEGANWYYSGYHGVSNPSEFLPGTYTFYLPNTSSCQVSIPIASGDHLVKSAVVARLTDSSGQPIAGADGSAYYAGGWHSIGTTDANGRICHLFDGTAGNATVALVHNGTRQQITQHQPTNSIYDFQTTGVTVELRNADGALIDTGSASYYAGGWHSIGDTSGGTIDVEMLPGDYSFAMVYNGGSRQQMNDVVISGNTTTVTFQTGRVSIYFSEGVSWYYKQFHTLSNPMEFLPGTVTFYLKDSGGCSVDLPIASGDILVKSAIVAHLEDSAGQPIAGATGSAYAGGWQAIGDTDAQGKICHLLDGQFNKVTVALVHNGTRQQITQHQPTDSIYDFQTTGVTVELQDSSGALFDTGSASYYAKGWQTIGDTSGGTVHVEMLPGSYSFAMVYLGTREQKNGVAISGNSTTVIFQTTGVTVELQDSSGGLIDTGSASYYAKGWKTIGDTSGGQVDVEMLPGSYSFAMVYLGTREQKNGVAISGSSTTVTFQTGEVNSVSGTATSYYAKGWKTFTNGMELLSGKYTFHFNDGTPNTQYTLVSGVVNDIH